MWSSRSLSMLRESIERVNKKKGAKSTKRKGQGALKGWTGSGKRIDIGSSEGKRGRGSRIKEARVGPENKRVETRKSAREATKRQSKGIERWRKKGVKLYEESGPSGSQLRT